MSKRDRRSAASNVSGGINEVDQAVYGDFFHQIQQSVQESPAPNGIVPQPDGSLSYNDMRITQKGIDLSQTEIAQDEFAVFFDFILRLEGSIQFVIGDLVVYGKAHKWEDVFQQIAAESGREISTLYDYSWVCGNIPFSVRTEKLAFGHHKLVASMKPADMQKWLAAAEREGWSVSQMRSEIKKSRQKKKPTNKLDDKIRSFSVHTEKQYKSIWNDLSEGQKRMAYAEVADLLKKMEEWGIDD